MGDIVPLTGPVIRPCQGRPKISDGEVKEVTARDELKEISRCLEKQDCYTPSSPRSVGSSISGPKRVLVQDVLQTGPFVRHCQGRPTISVDTTEVVVRDEEQEIASRMKNQVQIEEVKVGANVCLDGPVIRPFRERSNTNGNVKEVSGRDDQKESSRSMKKQVTPPSPKSVGSSISE